MVCVNCENYNKRINTGCGGRGKQGQDARKLYTPNLYDIYHCCVYSEKFLMMDRGTFRNMQSFYSKNKFEKLGNQKPSHYSHPTTQRPTTATNHIQQNQRSTPYAVTHGLCSPEDGHNDARNMLRQKLIINIRLLHLVGFFLSLHTLLTMHGHRNLKPKNSASSWFYYKNLSRCTVT